MSLAGYEPEGAPVGPLRLHLLGILHAHEGRYEEAEEAFIRAVEAEPAMAGSWVEVGLVYACRGEYARMIDALRRAVGVGAGGVRAYLDGRPRGDITTGPAAEVGGGNSGSDMGQGRDALALITLAISHLAAGRNKEAAAVLEPMAEWGSKGHPAVALLALSYLLLGEEVEATVAGVRRAGGLM